MYEEVAMFLLTVGHNCRNIFVQDVFQNSRETVSGQFHTVLRILARFGKEMIKPPSYDKTLPKILKNMKYYSWFNDSVDTINT